MKFTKPYILILFTLSTTFVFAQNRVNKLSFETDECFKTSLNNCSLAVNPPQLDQTCNIATTSTVANAYILTVMPVEQTPHCTHYFRYFLYNPQTNAWDNYLNYSISTPPYVGQVGLLKDAKYNVQHYIVSDAKHSNSSKVFEAAFMLKKPLEVEDSQDDTFVILSQRNIETISNIDKTSADARDLPLTSFQSNKIQKH